MRNPRITNKDLALIKAALRRVFARSEVRNRLVSETIIEHHDPKRKRVKTWCRCPICGNPTPKSYMVLDHRLPIIEIGKHYTDYTVQELADRIWCEEGNLQAICGDPCHKRKSREENKLRKEAKNERKRT